ncbi:hypothetical protein BJ170DRAFT_595315 [Xylariales sp. AK1849]|nr:hypothetical protein BJ170DRAFT_595315 [Xylariales sp. AK1849]
MPSLVKKPKAIFGGVVVATAGDLGNGYEEAKLSPWMKHHGGRFSADFDEFVTHLIATKEQYKKSGTRVREAKKRKTIEILTMDWLEFSMMQGKKLSTEKYSLRKQQKQTNAKKRRTEQAAKGIQQGEKFINENLYHPYTDSTFFRYNVTLINPATRGRYELTLFESNGEPRLYHTAAKYYKTSGAVPLFWRPSETPGSFEREFKNFKICFIKKTGVAWDDRMKEFGLKGKGKAGKRGDFQYIPPTAEKPVGLVNGEEWAGSARSIFGNDKKQANPGGGMETPPAGVEGNSTVVENVLTYLKGFVDDNKKDPSRWQGFYPEDVFYP